MKHIAWAVLLTLWCGTVAAASVEETALGFPLVCHLGETCWVANYVDVDPTEAAGDFRCKGRTYNAHDGTDFAIRDRGAMEQGVPVVASALGFFVQSYAQTHASPSRTARATCVVNPARSRTATVAAPAAADVEGGKPRIGLVLPDLANPFIAGIRDGAVAEAKVRNSKPGAPRAAATW